MDSIRQGGSVHYRDLFDDIDEYTGRRRRRAVHRVKRQLVLAAAAVGNVLGYFVPKWFKTDDTDHVDSRAMYESLAQKVAESHKTVIQLATQIPLIERAMQYNMDSIVDFFLKKIGRFQNNTEDHLRSMQTGELRMALIQANVIQELNRFSQLTVYSQVIHSCTNQQLSLLAVNQTSLTNELTRLKTNLNRSNFELIFDLNNFSAYYHLQLARCTVMHVDDRLKGGEVSLILTVPIRRREVYCSLIEGFTVPFLEISASGPQLCSIRFDHDLIVLKNGYPIPVTNSQTSSCSIEGGICYVDEYSSMPSTSVDCVRTLLRDATVAEVLNSCPYTCRPAHLYASF
jgi:hypothetical protein